MYDSILHEWFDQVWNQGKTDAVHRLLAPDALIHNLAQDGSDSRGADAFLAFFQKFREAFPDVHVTVHETVAQGDMAAARWTVAATHTGSGLGFAPTRRPVSFAGMTMARININEGRMVEGWNVWDVSALNSQLGFTVVPPTNV